MQEARQYKPRHLACRALGTSQASDEPNYCETKNGQWVATVKKFIQNLDYGEVVLSVHAGRVVQVEQTEKVRFG